MTKRKANSALKEISRRDELVQVAAGLFVEKGYKATTVRLIAEAADVQSGSLYHHFSSKEDILDELLGKYVRSALDGYAMISSSTPNHRECLTKLIEFAMEAVNDHRAALLLLQQEGKALSAIPRFKYLTEIGTRIEGIWRTTVRDGIRDGEFNPEIDPILPYYIVRDAVVSAARWFSPTGKWTVSKWTHQYVVIILSGLCVNPATRKS